MKTWQGLKHLEENSPVKQEDSYRFKAEANANKKYEGLIKETISRKFEQELFDLLYDKNELVSINTIRNLGNTISGVLSEILNDSDLKFAIKNLISAIESSGRRSKIQYNDTKLK